MITNALIINSDKRRSSPHPGENGRRHRELLRLQKKIETRPPRSAHRKSDPGHDPALRDHGRLFDPAFRYPFHSFLGNVLLAVRVRYSDNLLAWIRKIVNTTI